MTRVVVQVRCHDRAQKDGWTARASAAGLSLSEWLRRAGDDQAALEESLEREVRPVELLTEGVVFARDLAGPAKPFPRRG